MSKQSHSKGSSRDRQRKYLTRWLLEWELNKRILAATSADPQPFRPSSTRTSPYAKDFKISPVSLGEILLLGPGVLPCATRPVYLAVLAARGPGRWWVAPYGAFTVPATPGELLTQRSDYPLRVLCVWNSQEVGEGQLKRAWLAGSMTDKEIQESQAVFSHVSTGAALPGDLRERVGPPIFQEDDPRWDYQKEEARLLDVLRDRQEKKKRASDRHAGDGAVRPIKTIDWTNGKGLFIECKNISDRQIRAHAPDRLEQLAETIARSISSPEKLGLRPEASAILECFILPRAILASGKPIAARYFEKWATRVVSSLSHPIDWSIGNMTNRTSLTWRLQEPVSPQIHGGAEFAVVHRKTGNVVGTGMFSDDGRELHVDHVFPKRFGKEKKIQADEVLVLVEGRA